MEDENYGNLDQMLADVERMLERLPEATAPMRVRLVAGTSEERPFAGLRWIARILAPGEDVKQERSLIYPNAHLIEDWRDSSQLLDLLHHATTLRSILFGGTKYFTGKMEPSPTKSVLPGFNEYSGFPGTRIKFKTDLPRNDIRGSLSQYDLPHFDRIDNAVEKWTDCPRATYGIDTWFGTGVLFIPHGGPRIRRLTRESDGVHVLVECPPHERRRLRLQGAYRTSRDNENFGLEVTSATSIIPIPDGTYYIRILLIAEDSSVLDYHSEHPEWNQGHPAVLRTPTSNTLNLSIRDALLKGEGQRVEFKPFIAPGDSKMMEVVKTVVAFLNTEGGTIYLGISDEGEVLGLGSAGESKKKGKERSERDPAAWYKGQLRKLISDSVAPSATVEFEVMEFASQTILALTVPKGVPGIAYYQIGTNDIFVRRGATNTKAHPPTEIFNLMARPPEDAPGRALY